MMDNENCFEEKIEKSSKNIFKNLYTGLSKAEKKFIRLEMTKPQYYIKIDSNININIARKKTYKYIKKWRKSHIQSAKILNRFIIAHIRHNMSNYNVLVDYINNLPIQFKVKNEMIKRIKRKVNKKIKKQYKSLR